MFEEILAMAEMGIPEMMIDVAYAYEFGNGVEKDTAKAIEWYEKAGDAESLKRAAALRENQN